MRRSPSLLAVLVVLAALVHCEQRFSAAPPALGAESVAPPAPSGALEALLSPAGADAGPPEAEWSRALTVTLCSASSVPCSVGDAEAPAEGSYRVVSGSGHAEIRSRGQAMADVYKEVRDRTASGERLDAVPHSPRATGGAFAAGSGATTKESGDSSDAIAQCAFHLLDLVDGVGGVTLEVVPRFGATGCLVSVGRPGGDGGIPHCIIPEPERPNRPRTRP
jgi:hypothetical protein